MTGQVSYLIAWWLYLTAAVAVLWVVTGVAYLVARRGR